MKTSKLSNYEEVCIWCCSYNAYQVFTENSTYTNELKDGGRLDNWYKKYGRYELDHLEKTFPQPLYIVEKIGKTFNGYSLSSHAKKEVCTEFKVYKLKNYLNFNSQHQLKYNHLSKLIRTLKTDKPVPRERIKQLEQERNELIKSI